MFFFFVFFHAFLLLCLPYPVLAVFLAKKWKKCYRSSSLDYAPAAASVMVFRQCFPQFVHEASRISNQSKVVGHLSHG